LAAEPCKFFPLFGGTALHRCLASQAPKRGGMRILLSGLHAIKA
jgi:hypothetical protein